MFQELFLHDGSVNSKISGDQMEKELVRKQAMISTIYACVHFHNGTQCFVIDQTKPSFL